MAPHDDSTINIVVLIIIIIIIIIIITTTHVSTPGGWKAESAWLADLQRTV